MRVRDEEAMGQRGRKMIGRGALRMSPANAGAVLILIPLVLGLDSINARYAVGMRQLGRHAAACRPGVACRDDGWLSSVDGPLRRWRCSLLSSLVLGFEDEGINARYAVGMHAAWMACRGVLCQEPHGHAWGCGALARTPDPLRPSLALLAPLLRYLPSLRAHLQVPAVRGDARGQARLRPRTSSACSAAWRSTLTPTLCSR